jgi:hypothetical protein
MVMVIEGSPQRGRCLNTILWHQGMTGGTQSQYDYHWYRRQHGVKEFVSKRTLFAMK